MNTNGDGLFDEPVELSTQIQRPRFWTDEYNNDLVAWGSDFHQWVRHDELLRMERDSIQTPRHYENPGINAESLVQDYPMHRQPFAGVSNSLPGGFFDHNKSVGPGHENSSTSETTIDSIENAFEPMAQRSKRGVGNEFDEISGPRRKKARKISPTTAEITPESKAIHDKSKESPTRVFQELFESKHHAEKSLETIMELHRKSVADCSFPADDESFPKTDEEYRQRVRQVFDAICDWSYILEWRKVLPKGQEYRIGTEFSHDRPERRQEESMDDPPADFMPTEAELANILPPVEDQQRRVLRQIPNDQTIEWISWGIVDAAIKSQQGNTQVPYWCVSEGG
ncbi:hypothetical protein MAC_04283 [Metarhizium acridum CQMa 102]|uniref:Uncharacterized protein n=1 Tax=Metarhizium acridum (strain CQMa 102) TaxID=655827 RepID=E9E335_METAQ|nr:uncharacterized protein MAC_04283 [Metarhizium acridum CQMa 102]EFY89630.1 hypothetical protein MAC_04283 [Metarhizium acridum CQMa 102]